MHAWAANLLKQPAPDLANDALLRQLLEDFDEADGAHCGDCGRACIPQQRRLLQRAQQPGRMLAAR